MELLLLSNSSLPGKAWLEHALPLIAGQLNGRRSAVFIPFAGVTQTWDDYTAKAAAVLAPLGVSVTGIHSVADPVAAIAAAEVVIVGGGNTFQLLKECRGRGLLAPIVDVVQRGALYIGWSAGANLACPTIRTTNDMPVAQPPSLDAFRLVPFQINPHFIPGKPEGHNGESREERLAEFLVVNPGESVLALREGSALLVEGAAARLLGDRDALVFRQGGTVETIGAGESFSVERING